MRWKRKKFIVKQRDEVLVLIMDILQDPDRRRKIEEADLESLEKMRGHFSVGSWELELFAQRVAIRRHEELRPRAWYRTGIGWIGFLTLLAAIAAVIIGIIQLSR